MNSKKGKWTDEETNELLRLRKAGVPYKEIATQINRSAHACTQQYSKVKDAVANRKVKQLHLTLINQHHHQHQYHPQNATTSLGLAKKTDYSRAW